MSRVTLEGVLPGSNTQSYETDESTYLSRTIKWFRAEGVNSRDRAIRKIAAIAIAVLLSITIVGIFVVIKASIEWKRQDRRREFIQKFNNYFSSLQLDNNNQSLVEKTQEPETLERVASPPPNTAKPLTAEHMSSLDRKSFANVTFDPPHTMKAEVEDITPPPAVTLLQPRTINVEEQSTKPLQTLIVSIKHPSFTEELRQYYRNPTEDLIVRIDKALNQKIPKGAQGLDAKVLRDAKILAHLRTMCDLGKEITPEDEKRNEFKQSLYANFDMILRSYNQNQQLPSASFFND